MQIGEERTRFEVTKMVGSEVKRLHKRDFNAKGAFCLLYSVVLKLTRSCSGNSGSTGI